MYINHPDGKYGRHEGNIFLYVYKHKMRKRAQDHADSGDSISNHNTEEARQ
jgi:hypothetical protein